MEIIYQDICPFDLVAIAEGGQAFRWNLQDDGTYIGVLGDRVIKAGQDGNTLKIKTNDIRGAEDALKEYFDLGRDYRKLEKDLYQYEELIPALDHSSGYRILRQDPWETTISFIISANNHIRNIKNSVELLCQSLGQPISFEGKKYYTFPTPEALAQANIAQLEASRCGYRARYIKGTAEKIASGQVDLGEIKDLTSQQARQELVKLPGVGPKVAHCIMLFSMQKFDAFPVDVWIKRALETLYFKGKDTPTKELQAFAENRFGSQAGFVQQYLFRYFRG